MNSNVTQSFINALKNEKVVCIDHTDIVRHNATWARTLTSEMTDKEIAESAATYVRKNLPLPDLIAINELCADKDDQRVLTRKIIDCLVFNKLSYYDTLMGYYVDSDVATYVNDLLHDYLPLTYLFQTVTATVGVRNGPAEYAKFLRMVKAYDYPITHIRRHPVYSGEKYFYHADNDQSQIHEVLTIWCGLEKANFEVNIDRYVTLAKVVSELGCELNQLVPWLRDHMDDLMITTEACILIPVETMDTLLYQSKSLRSINTLIRYLAIQSKQSQKVVKPIVLDYIANFKPKWALSDIIHPMLSPCTIYYEFQYEEEIQLELMKVVFCRQTYRLHVLSSCTKLSYEKLIKQVEAGLIDAKWQDGVYRISHEEKCRVEMIADTYITLNEALTASPYYFDMNAYCRMVYIDYMEMHENFGIEVFNASRFPLARDRFGLFIKRESASVVCNKSKLFLKGYGKSSSEKTDILLNEYAKRFPNTIQDCQDFLPIWQECYSNETILQVLDTMLANLKKELTNMTEAEIEGIVKCLSEKSRESCLAFNMFLQKKEYSIRNYEFQTRNYKIEVNAYPQDAFCTMVAGVVNLQVWYEQSLVQKALGCQRYADLWLYMAMHVYTAWRNTDIIMCPTPRLRYDPQLVLDRIREGTYEDSDAKYVALMFAEQIKLQYGKPNKTQHIKNVPPLYFYCPESCLVSFGIILSIATAHFMLSERDQFIKPVVDIKTIKDFFGAPFAEACENSRFSSRRANKSLMQNVQKEILNSGEKTAYYAYTLIATMRSHKGGYGTVPESTDHYLRKTALSGYSVDEIVEQMFERGICSFAADSLLTACYGDSYTRLTGSKKTLAIRALQLKPVQIDAIVDRVNKVEHEVEKAIRELLKNSDCNPVEILGEILSSFAFGKSGTNSCVALAAKQPCQYPSRQDCVGCAYEIRTKSMLISLMKSYYRKDKGEEENPIIKEKNAWVRTKVLQPLILEIYQHLKPESRNFEMRLYGELAKDCQRIEEEFANAADS